MFKSLKKVMNLISIRREAHPVNQQKKDMITLENIINNIPAHIFWKNRECVLLGCNDLQAKNMGFSSGKEMTGKSNYDVIWQDQSEELKRQQADAITKTDKEVIHQGVTYVVEEPLVLPDGREAVYLSKKTPLRDEAGEIIGILGISFDITEKKEAERKLLEAEHKLAGMTFVSSTIAHELRTPLASLNLASSLLKETLPKLIAGHKLAEQAELNIEKLTKSDTNVLEKTPEIMQSEIHAALMFIDMLLMKLNPVIDKSRERLFSLGECVEDALVRYPFMGSQQRALVHWEYNSQQDFNIKGEALLVTHVLFNLLKNALYYVAAAGKGEIKIWLEKSAEYNKLYFKDTGAGIKAENLPHIFEKFFSKTYHGAGVGLTFCQWVMENLGGKISCESVEGEYTVFILSFPVT